MDYDVTKPKPTSRKIIEGCAVAVILSMVIGNMFVARRMRLMKVKIPNWDAAKEASAGYNTKTQNSGSSTNTADATKNSYNSSSSSRNASDNTTSQESSHFKQKSYKYSYGSRTRSSKSHQINAVSTNLIRSLSVLELPYYPIPSITTVKEAYYRLARKYHPDVFPADHPERNIYEQKFKNISAAYKECLEKLPPDQPKEPDVRV